MTDDEIRKNWDLAKQMQQAGDRADCAYRGTLAPTGRPNLAHRIAERIILDLEAAGVTDVDIERLYPEVIEINQTQATIAACYI